ncbi:trifunctional purine biosynthetic protein adenosine-3-like [Homalodisca vitripennis]|uniref:trifunctional purine biosynthetic protein adenosine-3-like n=1 Tax=Homalodisca vitripennis TaxID=197043 RepID=UPI001EEACC93|nr:trifunctional purine biosynthetic protein adenosine-3-like [Homalodisca vitripennis]XP_046687699.1 trifunctional purine biosynthetic protein adenosine-3-like [Homalodisca vitripennis]
MSANVLVIGGGGREHAICWKLAMSPKVKKVYAAPGNVGIGEMSKAENVDLNLKDFKAVAEWCIREDVSLVVVGPEDPLANGIADTLVAAGIKCFGPYKLAARIEAYKDWAKEFMKRHDIPTARWETFTDFSKAKEFIYRFVSKQEFVSYPKFLVCHLYYTMYIHKMNRCIVTITKKTTLRIK